MTQAISLRKRLIKTSMLSSIVAGLLALLLLVGISIYHTMKVQDQIMDEVADMLLKSDLSQNSGSQLDELSDEFDIQYQLVNGQQLLTDSTESAADEIDTEKKHVAQKRMITDLQNGYDIVWIDQRLQRSYQASDDDSKLMVNMLQPLSVRFKDLSQSFFTYLAVLLGLWAVQWGVLHFSVKKQFKSIQQLSNEIAGKNAQDLSTIQQPQPEFQELQPMVNQLNQMLTRLDQALSNEQRFTADASHELRSPLSAIQMRLQVLKRKYQDLPELQPYLDNIQQDVHRGTQVLENLLLLARLDPSDDSELTKTCLDLEAITQEVLQTLASQLREKQIQLHIENEQVKVYGNEELLFICIRNLIDNAIRYTPPQGNIYIHLGYLNNWEVFEIENDGEGIPPDILKHLGERFYRALGTKTQGSGLGLSICKKVAELHRGQMHIEASEHGGLKVSLYLH
ncbi:sensor histidine kinase [Acinetobacter sp. WCHAc060025]|uniref:sensor histidine kinase n=1 Tax=Acinetobacter sp. WCHAc060025 TaxID=2518625 RepID=UPI001023445A|nr:HAMP domain-containing sensor histidine kinase [Acinetobacter sp. WCHAc060025]RZG75792.1 HAMP domain-containing histidine kinase [Acinetobacter sp. WCHAc060025]